MTSPAGLVLAIAITHLWLAQSCCGTDCDASLFQHGYDLMGGDILPLGAGFRNATSPSDCCSQCRAAIDCLYFSYSPTREASASGTRGEYPPHNCWLKSGPGTVQKNHGRTSGSVNGTSPMPPPPNDACFPVPTAPWCNTSKSFAQRVGDLVSAMTIEEKIVQISTFTPSTVPGISRIGLPPYSYHSEGLHGLRNSRDTVGLNATLFPQTTGMAATGNMSLVKAMAAVMLAEARALNNVAEERRLGPFGRGSGLFYWSPTMNIGRDPRWGRFQESISEDPHLNGVYSAAFLQGFQGGDDKYLGVAATCKHLAAYSLEAADGFTRHNFDAIVSPQDLNETYLPAFKTCITKGKPAQIMVFEPVQRTGARTLSASLSSSLFLHLNGHGSHLSRFVGGTIGVRLDSLPFPALSVPCSARTTPSTVCLPACMVTSRMTSFGRVGVSMGSSSRTKMRSKMSGLTDIVTQIWSTAAHWVFAPDVIKTTARPTQRMWGPL